MRRLARASTLALLALACARPSGDLSPGDRIVARWEDQFFEATVIRAEGKLVEFAWDKPPPERGFQPRGFVTKLGDAYQEAQGPWALCPGIGWTLCRAASASESVRRSLLAVPVELRAWAASAGPRTEISDKATGTGELRPVELGTRVEPGQPVVARWSDGNFYSAKVVATAGELVTVAWADGTGEQAVRRGDVAPQRPPPITPGPREQILCVTSAHRWTGRVVITPHPGLRGTTLDVEDADGTLANVRLDECIRAAPARR